MVSRVVTRVLLRSTLPFSDKVMDGDREGTSGLSLDTSLRGDKKWYGRILTWGF